MSELQDFRNRLYESYASTHAGVADAALEEMTFRRDILPHLPLDRSASIVDLGCGQGHLVKQLIRLGWSCASGIDISPEQVQLAHASGISQVRLGNYTDFVSGDNIASITATDFFEHMNKFEVMEALDNVFTALAEGGSLIVRVPNSVSPFSGNFRYGDFTHETSFTARSLRQAGNAVGFAEIEVYPCNPVVHSFKSLVRGAAWKLASGAMKATLAVETGPRHGHLVTQNIVAVMKKS